MKIKCSFALKGIELEDKLFEHKDTSLNKFIETEGVEKESSRDLV